MRFVLRPCLRYHRVVEDDASPEARSSDARLRRILIFYVILPMAMMLAVWVWIKHERSKVRDRGYAACVTAGREPSWCEAAADKNHERCMELTFRPGTRTSPGGFDEQGYIECLDIGATAFWKLSAERAAERRRSQK